VIQVNGKKRGSITVIENLSEKELIDQIKDKRLISKYLDNGELVKTIYIKDRLINFIIK
jgi:leucyl-tRNA synthetase